MSTRAPWRLIKTCWLKGLVNSINLLASLRPRKHARLSSAVWFSNPHLGNILPDAINYATGRLINYSPSAPLKAHWTIVFALWANFSVRRAKVLVLIGVNLWWVLLNCGARSNTSCPDDLFSYTSLSAEWRIAGDFEWKIWANFSSLLFDKMKATASLIALTLGVINFHLSGWLFFRVKYFDDGFLLVEGHRSSAGKQNGSDTE